MLKDAEIFADYIYNKPTNQQTSDTNELFFPLYKINSLSMYDGGLLRRKLPFVSGCDNLAADKHVSNVTKDSSSNPKQTLYP